MLIDFLQKYFLPFSKWRRAGLRHRKQHFRKKSNQFSTFPAVLTRVPNLQELNLASNQITVLPAEIGELPLSANIKM